MNRRAKSAIKFVGWLLVAVLLLTILFFAVLFVGVYFYFDAPPPDVSQNGLLKNEQAVLLALIGSGNAEQSLETERVVLGSVDYAVSPTPGAGTETPSCT